jgi:hypothetical protein
MRAVWVVALLTSSAVAEPVRAPTCSDPVPNRPAPRRITDVDWCNFDAGMWKGSLRAGHSSLHLYRKLSGPHDTIATSLRGVVYGDLDGDRTREAAVVIERTAWYGGASTPSSNSWTVYVYDFAKGTARLRGTIAADKPVHAITFAKRTVTVSSGEPAATTRFRWDATSSDFVELPAP